MLGRDWLEEIHLDWANIQTVVKTEVDKLQNILASFQVFFKEELGCLKSTKVKLYVDRRESPIFYKARPIPYSIRPKVMEELARLEKSGVIRPVEFSDWATPIVPVLKSSGDVRICGDYKLTVNKVCKTDYYPLPLVDELFAKMSGGKIFSKYKHTQGIIRLHTFAIRC